MTNVADILRSAADLLEPEGAWTKGASARNAEGGSVSPRSPDACSWCVLGALDVVTVDVPPELFWRALLGLEQHLERHLEIGNLAAWNDEQPNSKPVVAVLRAAAEAAS